MPPTVPKILLFGTGSVGSIYATLLSRAGATVVAVCRSTYPAISAGGITVRSAKWGTLHCRPAAARSASDAAAAHGPFDYILVAAKAFPGTAVEAISDAVSPDTAIVLAQNGIGIEAEYAERYPRNVIISGCVWLPAMQSRPGVVVHSYPLERLELGTYPADAGPAAQARVREMVALFASAGATAVFCDDVQRQRWGKLAVNASMNPVCALALCDDANYFRSSGGPRAMRLVTQVQLEVAAVADAAGYGGEITEEGIAERMSMYEVRMTGGGKEASMLVDVKARRPMEVEAILGNLVRMAEEKGVDVPLLGMLYVLATARNSEIVRDERWKPLQMLDEEEKEEEEEEARG